MIQINKIHLGDALALAKQLESDSIDCIVTSPPYWNLRDYGVDGQWGQEETPQEHVFRMVELFSELRRALKPSGTCWINYGDSYASASKSRTKQQAIAKHRLNGGTKTQIQSLHQKSKIVCGLKQKDLVGMPWRIAFGLQDSGWYLRQDIIWHKPNPMPESVRDRCTKAHEYIFMLTKSRHYFYDSDAIREDSTYIRRVPNGWAKEGSHNPIEYSKRDRKDRQRGHSKSHAGFNDRWDHMTREEQAANGRNKRDVWTVPTRPYSESHFATFPLALIEPCVLAGCPEGGVVLDPFIGSGTTAQAAIIHRRKWIGFEINNMYISLAKKRIDETQVNLFA